MNITISALREKLLSSVEAGTVRQRDVQQPDTAEQVRPSEGITTRPASDSRDPVELSVSRDVFKAVDNFFNLGRSGRFDGFHSLSPADKEQFVEIVAELAKAGYVGFEELVVNHKIERHEVASQIGNKRLRLARVYDNSKEPRR